MRGVSLYIAVVIMAVLLSIVLGISAILISQIKVMRGMESSVIAFFAAESGIERVLVDRANPGSLDGYSETLDNGASYQITVLSSGVGGCPASNYCIKSVGKYRETRRAIEVSY